MCKKWLRMLAFYGAENVVKFPWGKKIINDEQQCTQGMLSRDEYPPDVEVT